MSGFPSGHVVVLFCVQWLDHIELGLIMHTLEVSHNTCNIYNQAAFCGRDRMVVGLTTIYAIGAYHHWCCEFESRSGRSVQHYFIKFVSDLRQVSGFSPGLPVSSTNKTYLHDITAILLKVALNTIKQPKTYKQITILSTNSGFFSVRLIYLPSMILHQCPYHNTL